MDQQELNKLVAKMAKGMADPDSKVSMRCHLKDACVTPNWIKSLKPGEVFVFGSNEAGIHGAGAAKMAKDKFGAISGYGFGLQGRSYGIPTCDRHFKPLPLYAIEYYIAMFLGFAMGYKIKHPNDRFLVTEIGTGLCGYSAKQIAPLFLAADRYIKSPNDIPDNVSLPAVFWVEMERAYYNNLVS